MQIFLEIAISLAAVCFVLFPLIKAGRPQSTKLPAGLHDNPTRDELAEPGGVLEDELKELEFDRQMGKITDDDFDGLTASAAGATHVLQQRVVEEVPERVVVDALRETPAESGRTAGTLDPDPSAAEREIEAEVLVARARLANRARGEDVS